jgi:cell division septal protein FtsQ
MPPRPRSPLPRLWLPLPRPGVPLPRVRFPRRGLPLARLWRLPLRLKLVFAALLVAVGVGGWLVLRDSQLFAVHNVTIVGLSPGAVPQVSRQLVSAARLQTTTDFSPGAVQAAVVTDSLITGVRAATHFPHGVILYVTERLPVARVEVAGESIPLAADGRVVTGFSPSIHLPTVRSGEVPLGGRTDDPFVRVALRVLATAPTPLFARVAAVTRADGALTIYLHHGPRLIFGDGALPHAKWDAAAAVLGARSSRGAAYINLVLPWRPAAQVGDPATSGSAGTSTGVPASATTTRNPAVVQLSGSA